MASAQPAVSESEKEALARGVPWIPLQGEGNMASPARQPAQTGTLAPVPGMRSLGRASRMSRGRNILAIMALTIATLIYPSSCAVAGAKATPHSGAFSRTSAKSGAMPPGDGDKKGLEEGLGMEILRLSGGSGISDGHRERLVSTRRVPGSFGGKGRGGASRGGGGGGGGTGVHFVLTSNIDTRPFFTRAQTSEVAKFVARRMRWVAVCLTGVPPTKTKT